MPENGAPKGATDLLSALAGSLVELMQAEARSVLSDAVTEVTELLAEVNDKGASASATTPKAAATASGNGRTTTGMVPEAWLGTAVRAAIEDVAPYLTMDVGEAIAEAVVKRARGLRSA